VRAGTGGAAPTQLLRYIRWRRGGTRYEVLTNVLAPTRLAADEALALYPYRWSVERMYFDLKTVLNLNRVYAANPNGVAMQVYAAGLVYNAMRVAQSEAAVKLGVPPEEISPAKFFPRVAVACYLHSLEQQWARDVHRRHPRTHFRLSRPRRRWAGVTLTPIHVEHRTDHRWRRRFCAARRTWTWRPASSRRRRSDTGTASCPPSLRGGTAADTTWSFGSALNRHRAIACPLLRQKGMSRCCPALSLPDHRGRRCATVVCGPCRPAAA
jgi:hypothetical protein